VINKVLGKIAPNVIFWTFLVPNVDIDDTLDLKGMVDRFACTAVQSNKHIHNPRQQLLSDSDIRVVFAIKY
jgi:hypothetical protein